MSDERPVFAVVLAAGRGERFGGAKQLADIDGQPMVRRACELARAVCGDNTLLVTGHDSAAVLRAAGDDVGFVVVNDHHADGIGSSIAAAVREARHCTETGETKTLLFNLSGHGHFDMSSYDRYFAGELEDFDYQESAIQESLRHLPKVG